MLRIIFLIGLMIFSVPTFSQNYPDSLSLLIPARAIKFSPLHLLGFYPSLQFAYEYKISDKFSMQTDLGYVFNNGNFNDRFLNKRGIKARQEIRLYYDLYHKSDQAYYFSLELYFNGVNFNRKELRTECFDLDCMQLFNRQYNYVVKFRENGISFKNGFIKYFTEQIFVDMSFGLTIRNIRYIKPILPPAFNEGNFGGWFQFPNENNRIGVAPLFNLRLGYRLK
jgi:hypothetical protein